ncbi:hypothetical protein GJ496_008010 [Pomphorhynchus laevis]|nr:hypothetical protein GJ496_008010 [Pomphorhynchus laevis]
MEYSYSQRICETYNAGLHSDNLNNLQADIIKGIITTRKIEYQNRLSSILDTLSIIDVVAKRWLWFLMDIDFEKLRRSWFQAIFLFVSRWITNICMVFYRSYKQVSSVSTLKYVDCPLTIVSFHRLSTVNRKILVLDLDETLIHSQVDSIHKRLTNSPPDFCIKIKLGDENVRFFVYKRPFVDDFLSTICQWFELVIFTASLERYGSAIADNLDSERKLITRRFFRQHCTPCFNGPTKDLSIVSKDLSSIIIIDNSPVAYQLYKQNAIPIKSWFSDRNDRALLNLLPFLDALRFTADVRSVLGRC